jgi:hypothetical protein
MLLGIEPRFLGLQSETTLPTVLPILEKKFGLLVMKGKVWEVDMIVPFRGGEGRGRDSESGKERMKMKTYDPGQEGLLGCTKLQKTVQQRGRSEAAKGVWNFV